MTQKIAELDTKAPFALMLLDLDRFRAINDTLGHDQGDLVIKEIAKRLTETLSETDLISRLGGDEFAVLLKGVSDGDAALRAAEKVRAGVEHPITMDGMKIDIAANIGIAMSPVDERDVTTLMQKADVAMYQAKAARGGARVYDSTADGNTPERLGMIAELRHAIEQNELVLFYQPKARLDTGSVESVDALVRWRHPERGLVPPGMFIPLAEETGLIKEITVWVVDEALRQARQWRTLGTALPISVNISAQNLHDPALTSDIASRLDEWGADADWISLEITESAVMENPEGAVRGLAELADMGLEIAMDDYGTGYSALNYLKRLPLSELKIDRSFVSNITADQTDALIIGSTIELGHSLGLRIVAEGVETESDWLGPQMLGCDIAQGFFLGRPMPADEFDAWLTDSGRDFVDCVPTAS